MKITPAFTLGVYAAIGFLQVCGVFLHLPPLAMALKPFLMPLLIWTVWQQSRVDRGAVSFRTAIYGALFFSWLGDLFLMVPGERFLFFLAGLVSFLLAHLAYILWFSRRLSGQTGLLRRQPLWILPVLLFYGGFMRYLLPYVEEGLKIPVAVYALIICSMLLSVVHTRGLISDRAFRMALGGAVSFLLSDSLLAINKFAPVGAAAVVLPGLVMLTYILAQGMLVWGILRSRD
jgi:uncharacterized membrane protein YhhN